MMVEAARPDPDALLAQLEIEGLTSGRGRLKIFLGAAAGVGKTYAMLEAAHAAAARRVDVVVGVVETHGRPETAALLEGLESCRRARSPTAGAPQEFDLDAALARRPALLLRRRAGAHQRARLAPHQALAGRRGAAGAGIDVYTTLNVQHLESLERRGGADHRRSRVRETVPDSILESADEIELIDCPRTNCSSGCGRARSTFPSRPSRRCRDFFRQGNLIALRELALRAPRSASTPRCSLPQGRRAASGPGPSRERILVCVSPSPAAVRIVRAGGALARRLQGRVDRRCTSRGPGTPRSRRRTATTPRRTLQAGRETRRRRPSPSRRTTPWKRSSLRARAQRHEDRRGQARPVLVAPGLLRGSFVDRMARRSGDIDVYVVHGDRKAGPLAAQAVPAAPAEPLGGPRLGDRAVAVMHGGRGAWRARFAPPNLIMIYLLGVVIVAARWGAGPSFSPRSSSVAAFDFFFVPPHFTFAVADTQYVVTFVGDAGRGAGDQRPHGAVREQAIAAPARAADRGALRDEPRPGVHAKPDTMIAAVKRAGRRGVRGQVAVLLPGTDGRL